MRTSLSVIGMATFFTYAIVGAVLMNNCAVVAASEIPLAETITAMDAAGQPYSMVPGIIFAALGTLLACAWGALALCTRTALPSWAAIVCWAAILACGAPAYFFTSFANVNAVGDTFYDWNADAAIALEAPLYAVSGIALLIAVTSVVVTILKARAQTTPSAAD